MNLAFSFGSIKNNANLSRRSSKLGSCTCVKPTQRTDRGGHAVDMPFVILVTGERTHGGGSVQERPRPASSISAIDTYRVREGVACENSTLS